MNLRTKLIGGFFAVAAITLLVSAIGYWQTQKLAAALYEVGVVRMPSLQALDSIFEAKTSLDASKRELMRESTLFDNDSQTLAEEPPDKPADRGQKSSQTGGNAAKRQAMETAWKAWHGVLAEELKRQQQAWRRAEKGWKIYEALPKTRAEADKWQAFVPVWAAWRVSYEKVMTLLEQGAQSGDRDRLTAAQQENEDNLYDPARKSREFLTELLEMNNQTAAATKRQSVASYRDMRMLGYVMLLAAAASVAAAIGCGIFMSRLISRPISQMAGAFSRISRGDLHTHVPIGSRDEIGQMAEAMNRMVDSLRTSELRFRAVFENSIDAIGVSKGGQMVLANPALLSLFGYSSEQEIIGQSVLDFIAPAEHARVRERMARRARGEPLPAHYELTGRRRDGGTFTMELQSAPFTLNGETHIVAIHRDITERQRAATLLAESAERLELALHTSKLGVWRRHLTTHAVEWDERMFVIYGLPLGAPAPTREQLMALVVPEDYDMVWRSWNQPPAAGRIYQQRFRINRPDGRVRHLEVHGMVHGEAGRAPEWSIGVTGDITDIVDAAAESVRLREQLLQAQKMETLGTLSAGIAHDFNNLLTSINGFVELAATTLPGDHEAAVLLQRARQGTLSARELVRRILTFSRRSHDSKRTFLSLGAVVKETAPLISAALPRHIQLALDIFPSLPPVYADTGQIQQVLMNLCTNGAHAIGAQSGTLRIGVGLQEFSSAPGAVRPAGCQPGRYVCLSVSDTGCGMDAATLQRIFEPFYTTKKAGEGTGLGLAIVNDIVVAHEGGLEVTSTPGRGTTFSLYFPATAGEEVSVAVPEARIVRRGAAQKIMVVDDEPAIAMVVQISLEKAGYNPEVFTSSQEAWDRFTQAPGEFHLLMIDQQMPGLSGADFIVQARQLVPRLPIIRMSGRFERSDTVNGRHQAGIRQMKKPFELGELLEHVSAALHA